MKKLSKIQEDNLEISDWFSKNRKEVNLWITDPPYPFDSQNGTNRYSGMYDRMSYEQLAQVYESMYDITPEGGRAYVFCNRDGIQSTIDSLAFKGRIDTQTGNKVKVPMWKFRNIIVWDKEHFGGGYHWRNQVEYIVYVTKGASDTYIQGAPNIMRYPRPVKADAISEIGYDPSGTSSKPSSIWRDILMHGAVEGDVCADIFAGTNPLKAALFENPELYNKISKAYTNTY